jgi:hypothetical protein
MNVQCLVEEQMSPDTLKTAVSWAEADRILIRGYRIQDLIGRVSLGQAAYLLLVGELPERKVGKTVEAILVSVIAHGPAAPATRSAITVADTGASLSASVAAGVLAITGTRRAIEDCMTVLEECVAMKIDPFEAATEVVRRIASAGSASRPGSKTPGRPTGRPPVEYARSLAWTARTSDSCSTSSGPLHRARPHAAVEHRRRHRRPVVRDQVPKEAANGLFLISRVRPGRPAVGASPATGPSIDGHHRD